MIYSYGLNDNVYLVGNISCLGGHGIIVYPLFLFNDSCSIGMQHVCVFQHRDNMSDSEKKDSSCCSYCCCCFNICYPQKQKKRVAGVEYELVPSTSERMIFNNIPTPDEMMKEFSLPQDKTEYAVPLSLNPQNEKRWIRRPITAQPKPQRSISEPDLSSGFNPSADVVESPETTLPSMEGTQSLPIHTFSPTVTTTSHYKQISMPDELVGQKSPLSSIDDIEEPADESHAPSQKPEIEFSLYYDIQGHTLTVHLQCAHNLPIRGKVNLDPTVVLYLLPNRENIFLSQVIRDTNPTFNQSFEFRDLLPDEIRRQTLVFQVCSHSSKGEILGGLSLSLSEADLSGAMCRRRLDTDIEKQKVCIYDI